MSLIGLRQDIPLHVAHSLVRKQLEDVMTAQQNAYEKLRRMVSILYGPKNHLIN